MAHAEYPFFSFPWQNNTTRVYLPVRLTNPATGDSTNIEMALVDTGADACAIPGSIACALQHDLKHQEAPFKQTSGIDGTHINTYGHTFKLELLSADAGKVVWSCEQAVIECLDKDIPILLGAADFLANFRITIDYPQQKVLLQW